MPAFSTIFDGTYKDNAHMQREFNERYLKQIVEQIKLKFPDKNQKLSFLDIGCGDGDATKKFYLMLKEVGYTDVSVEGADISEQQIQRAKVSLTESADEGLKNNVSFKVCDALQLNEQGKHDGVYSLFTFHWIDDKRALSRAVADALKDQGFLFFLTVTPLPEIFAIRKALLVELADHEDWKEYFSGYDITPFASFEASDTAFKERFNAEKSEEISEPLTYNFAQFKKFLTSWLPEIRQIRVKLAGDEEKTNEIIDQYLDRLIAKMSEVDDNKPKGLCRSSNTIYFPMHYGIFSGIKKGGDDAAQVPSEVPIKYGC